MGPVPGWEGLSVASGHDHAGIMLSSGSAELMADYIASGDATSLEAFLPSRFAGGATLTTWLGLCPGTSATRSSARLDPHVYRHGAQGQLAVLHVL
jgi:hypothetical protein